MLIYKKNVELLYVISIKQEILSSIDLKRIRKFKYKLILISKYFLNIIFLQMVFCKKDTTLVVKEFSVLNVSSRYFSK